MIVLPFVATPDQNRLGALSENPAQLDWVQNQVAFATSSVCDRVVFAWPSPRSRTRGHALEKKTGNLAAGVESRIFSGQVYKQMERNCGHFPRFQQREVSFSPAKTVW